MCELRASRTFANRPDAGSRRFQLPIHTNEAACVEFHPGLREPDPIGVRNSANCNEQIAALNLAVAGVRMHGYGKRFSGLPFNADWPGVDQDLDTLASEYLQNFPGNVSIFPSHQLPARLDDRHATTEPPECLRHFDSNVTAAKHNQMFG